MVGFIYVLLCRLLVVGPGLKWLALLLFLLCRPLVVGTVLKWLALLLLFFLRVHSPGQTVLH